MKFNFSFSFFFVIFIMSKFSSFSQSIINIDIVIISFFILNCDNKTAKKSFKIFPVVEFCINFLVQNCFYIDL